MKNCLRKIEIAKDRRGMVGIGTMIVFIAMIIVAAVAAGVLINTSGSLQQQARATGEETIAEVSSGVRVLAAKGYTDGSGNVDNINLIVRPYAGSQGINLENTVIQYKDSDEVNHLNYHDNAADMSATEHFVVSELQNVGGGAAEDLRTMGDISKVSIKNNTALTPSDSATITFYPNSGFKTVYGIQVPPTTRTTTWYEL